MASSLGSPEPLRGKISQVKYLLDNANKRLQENYEIFTTKSSASGSTSMQMDNEQNVTLGLKRTMNDISTLRSVLNCPIFNRIVDVTDSLDKLSYQLNMHPSIGPSDYNIDANGELILTPPFETTHFPNSTVSNKPIESALNNACTPPQISGHEHIKNNVDQVMLDGQSRYRQQQPGYDNGNPEVMVGSNLKHVLHDQTNMTDQRQQQQQQYKIQPTMQNYSPPNINPTFQSTYNNEKLVSNGANKNFANGNKLKNYNLIKSESSDGHRCDEEQLRYQLEQRYSLDHGYPCEDELEISRPINRVVEQHNSTGNGYSNEMYHNAHELNSPKPAIAATAELNGQSKIVNYEQTIKNGQVTNVSAMKIQSGRTTNIINNNRSSCSPSTSAGSTVRLADECDSGASSYLSNNVKNETPCSPYPYKHNELSTFNNQISATDTNPVKVASNAEQEVTDDLPSDMERIEVTLEKDEKDGLGITVAGYTFEKEEISGIFIKSILPNSPAERSGKIRALDQIFSVNGKALLGYNNTDAVRELKQTPKIVTLELVRYPDGLKYQKLQAKLAKVQRESSSNKQNPPANAHLTSQENDSAKTLNNVEGSPAKSSIPIYKNRDSSSMAVSEPTSPTKPSIVQYSTIQTPKKDTPEAESIYKNDVTSEQQTRLTSPIQAAKQRFSNDSSGKSSSSQIPIAAQRGGSNKVIETKQGARNTIDIRSPVCQSTTATHVNKIADIDFGESVQNRIANLLSQNHDSNEFSKLIRNNEPEWEKDAQIIEIYKDSSQGLGFKINDYNNPRDPQHPIIMVTSLTPGGIAEKDGRLNPGDLLIFVDDTNLEGASMNEAVKALKKTNGQVRLGVLKMKRMPQD